VKQEECTKWEHLGKSFRTGMITQIIAIRQPAGVATLTLMMTSGYVGDPDLPGLSSRYFLTAFLKGIPLLKYRLISGEKNLIRERIAKTAGTSGYDELDVKETAELVLYDLRKRRGVNIRAALQHQAAISASGSRYEALKSINMPTLVVHGTDDPLIPVEHGQKLAALIPGAQALWLQGVGHVFPVPDMEELLGQIISHFDRRWKGLPDCHRLLATRS
jgi:pimeloyl-ACP methyl ester carboxylesterase